MAGIDEAIREFGAVFQRIPGVSRNSEELGMVSRTEQIVELAKNGFPPKEIQARLPYAVSGTNIRATLVKARRTDATIPRFGAPKKLIRAAVDTETIQALRNQADRRGVPLKQFTGRLLTTIIQSDLVNAVLDDGD